MTPSLPEKIKALEHVHYEIERIVLIPKEGVGFVLPLLEAAAELRFSEQTLLESRLIHIRNVLVFFDKKARHKSKPGFPEDDDILALDYGYNGDALRIPTGVRRRINKDLAHLTYSRNMHTPATKRWYFDPFYPALVQRCLDFAQHILEGKFHPLSDAQLAPWRALAEYHKQRGLVIPKGDPS